jgi:hypothetical protein
MYGSFVFSLVMIGRCGLHRGRAHHHRAGRQIEGDLDRSVVLSLRRLFFIIELSSIALQWGPTHFFP